MIHFTNVCCGPFIFVIFALVNGYEDTDVRSTGTSHASVILHGHAPSSFCNLTSVSVPSKMPQSKYKCHHQCTKQPLLGV